MMRPQNPNLQIIEAIAEHLGDLTDEVVFLGGSTTGILITDPGAPSIRVTQDVDVIVAIMTRAAYYRFCDKLRQHGFSEDSSEGAPICRWLFQGMKLDVMPIAEEILGFSNRWYGPAFKRAGKAQLPSGRIIRCVTPPDFIVTKFEAFLGRGRGDHMMSHDLEDIMAVVDGRSELIEEIQASEADLREYVGQNVRALLADRSFRDALPGFLPGDAASQGRLDILIARLERMANFK